MAKRVTLFWALFLLTAFGASAGDIAQFVNLGFSADSKYFMFGQYGVSEKTSSPFAETFVVDVAKNVYAPRGVTKVAYTRAAEPGASGLGALLTALADALPQTRQYRIDHLLTGRMLYILMDGAPANEVLEFRDFQTGHSYSVSLLKGSGSSFHITASVTDKTGAARAITAGDPSIQRQGVKSYQIKQIILAPNGNSLVFLIQKEEQDTKGSNVRYMVETVRLQ
jgi:predicted secreted protein